MMDRAPAFKEHSILRRQGMLFCALALAGLIATPWLGRVNDQTLLLIIASAILLLGVPHGALDTLFAQRLYRITTRARWVVFIVFYVLLAAFVVVVWWSAPHLFLILFLTISAFHFSADPDVDIRLGARIFYGATIIVLPAALHAPQVTTLFAQLVGSDAASDIVGGLKWLIAPLLIGVVLLMVRVVLLDRLAAIEILGVVLLALFASPLIAFTLFFCCMHSPRHLLRAAALTGITPKHLMINVAVIPTLATIVLAGFGMLVFSKLPVNERMMRIIFVGLAALTVPHMMLVEQVRLRRWRFPHLN